MTAAERSWSVRNWREFQHYKDRLPPWIKLHRALLDDSEWGGLSPNAAKALINIWLIAADTVDGALPPLKQLAYRLRLTVQETEDVLAQLAHWVEPRSASVSPCEQPASNLQAARKHLAAPETETETEAKTKTKKKGSCASAASSICFARFWSAYPKKKNRGTAEKAWLKINPDDALLTKILEAVEAAKASDDWRKAGGEFIPYPATWLNAQGWQDELFAQTYDADAEEVIAGYNEILIPRGWPEALRTPYSRDRAGAIAAFRTFMTKPGFHRGYFEWLANNLTPRPGCGFDWAIRRDTFLRAREGNFAALQEAA